MDGTHRQVLVDSHIKWPNGITLDYSAERLYWVDAKMNLIASCNFDGSKRRIVLANSQIVRHPFSITIFEDWIYWTDWEHQSIMRANKFNGSNAHAISAAHRVSVSLFPMPFMLASFLVFTLPVSCNLPVSLS